MVVVIAAGVVLALGGVMLRAYELSAVTGVCSVLMSALAVFLSRRPASAAVRRVQHREYAVESLAELVRVQWEEEAKIRGLADPDPMPVAWTLTAHDVADHPHHIFTGPPGFDERKHQIAGLTERFLALSRRRLVTLVTRLGQDHPGGATASAAARCPVTRGSYSGAVDREQLGHRRLSADAGLAGLPARQVLFRAARDRPGDPPALVDSNLVLPVIDGLDELDPAEVWRDPARVVVAAYEFVWRDLRKALRAQGIRQQQRRKLCRDRVSLRRHGRCS